MLKVWGRPYSSNVIPVIWAVNELGLKYDLMLAGGSFGKLGTDQYAKINPNRMIPAIQDGEFALWESLSIIRYLSEKYGKGSLLPSDPQVKAIADQWMEWSASKAFGPVIYLFFATVRTEPAERDIVKITRLRDEAHEALTILDQHLSNQAYVCGDKFTMGDIPLGCIVYRYFNIKVDRPKLPNVEAWYQRLSERPAYRKNVMRHFGENPTDWAALEKACESEGIT